MLRDAEGRALARLPATYADALRLRARGLDEPAIATELGLEPQAVGPLVRVATAKLATLLENERHEEPLHPDATRG